MILIFAFMLTGLVLLADATIQTVTTKTDYEGQTAKPVYIMETNAFQKQIEWSAGLPIYVGESLTGKLPNENAWRIKKISYDVSNNPVNITWANNSNNFEFKWENRSTYTFG